MVSAPMVMRALQELAEAELDRHHESVPPLYIAFHPATWEDIEFLAEFGEIEYDAPHLKRARRDRLMGVDVLKSVRPGSAGLHGDPARGRADRGGPAAAHPCLPVHKTLLEDLLGQLGHQ